MFLDTALLIVFLAAYILPPLCLIDWHSLISHILTLFYILHLCIFYIYVYKTYHVCSSLVFRFNLIRNAHNISSNFCSFKVSHHALIKFIPFPDLLPDQNYLPNLFNFVSVCSSSSTACTLHIFLLMWPSTGTWMSHQWLNS